MNDEICFLQASIVISFMCTAAFVSILDELLPLLLILDIDLLDDTIFLILVKIKNEN